MAVRRFRDDPFTGAQEIQCAPGACTTLPGGAWTLAALVYCRGAGSPVVTFRTGSTRLLLLLDSTELLITAIGGFGQSLAIPDVQDQWIIVGASRPAGADNLVRGHVYYLDSETWVHDNLAGTAFDEASTITDIRLGRNPDSTSSFHGDIGLITAWGVELDDADFETLPPGLSAWVDLAPLGCWPLDQDDVGDDVVDITDNGADQVAIVDTTVATDNDPDFNFDLTPPQVTSDVPLTIAVNPVTSAVHQVTASIPLALAGDAQSAIAHQASAVIPLSVAVSPSTATDALASASIPLSVVLTAQVPSTELPGRPLMPDAEERSLPFGPSGIAEARPLRPDATERLIMPEFE